MPVPTNISQLSQTASSNSPPGSESPTTADDYLREYASYIAQLRDGKGFTDEVDVASAATCDIGAVNSFIVRITGTTTITSLGTTYNGPRFVRFADALTLTHNASTLVLPGAANITTAAGDAMLCVPNGSTPSGWRVLFYQRAALNPDRAASGANSDITSLSAITSINGGQLAGTRNKIINGAMGIDQRNSGSAQTITAAAALAYTVDQWYAYCTGANVTGQRVAGTAPNQFNYRFTGAASVTKIGFAQRIEAVNSQDLAGQTATLSVDLANSLLTTVTWTAWYANSADTFGTLASPTRTQIATGTFTVSSTLTRYSTQISVPSAATTGIEVEFSVGAQTSGTWTIGRAQLEVGAVATSFEHINVAQELVRCQRFYEPGQFSLELAGYATGAIRCSGFFKVTKRTATPTITPVFAFQNANTGTIDQITAQGFRANALVISNANAGITVTYTASDVL